MMSVRIPKPWSSPEQNENLSILESFGTNLSKLAESNLLDPVIGRSYEIKRLSQILCRKKKNNAILLGDAGVGKTSIVEGLAIAIFNKTVPYQLLDKQIYTLELSNLLAGTKYRGEFEERIKLLIEELKENKNIIIFIDEIHTIISSGNSGGSLDAANMLKPSLSNGSIQVIGATTFEEYKTNIEKDSALMRRFQNIKVEEPSLEDVFKILQKSKSIYENFHNIKISDNCLLKIVDLADRYISNRKFPDKAFDILDEVGSYLKLNKEYPKELIELEYEIKRYSDLKDLAIKEVPPNYEMGIKYRDLENGKKEELKRKHTNWVNTISTSFDVKDVTIEDIEDIVSKISGVPIIQDKDKFDNISKIDINLYKHIIGQDHVINSITPYFKRNFLGLKDKNKPIASFFFLGPTGVGKTELAKSIALEVFGDSKRLIRLDMNEYGESFNSSRIIGSAPGYIGYEHGGELSEKVKQNPYSVILFDEIEKAHTSIYNLFLNILDEGYITNSFGNRIDFSNTVIIFTSNIGMSELENFKNGLGFLKSNRTQVEKNEIIENQLKKKFKPEFLNRLDEILYFNSLTENDVEKILSIELAILASKYEKIGINIKLTKAAKKHLIETGFSQIYGARFLKRTIHKLVENLITDYIVKHKMLVGNIEVNCIGKTLKIE